MNNRVRTKPRLCLRGKCELELGIRWDWKWDGKLRLNVN